MKISTRDKKILLMFLGVAFLAAGYFFVYKPQMGLVEQIESENYVLAQKLEELQEMEANKDYYVDETQKMQSEIQLYSQEFPPEIRPEDGIVLARNMENSLDMKISSVGLGERQFLYSMEDGADSSGASQPDQTLSEQNNAATQAQINEIEGIEENQEDGNQQVTYNTSDMALYRNQNSIQFVVTYDGLKRAVEFLAQQRGRMTLNNVSASFDAATGNLSGSMSIDIYSMTGTGGQYQEPDAGSVPYGTNNIFGTIEAPVNEGGQQAAEGGNNDEGAPADQNQVPEDASGEAVQ